MFLLFYYNRENTYLVQVTEKRLAKIKVSGNTNSVEIIKHGNVIIKYTDTLINGSLILRAIGKFYTRW